MKVFTFLYLLLSLNLFTTGLVYGQQVSTHNSTATGFWSIPETWVDGNFPDAMNRMVVNIYSPHTVTHTGDLSLNNDITINVHPGGDLIIEGSVDIGQNDQHPFTFEINGVATIKGDLLGYGDVIGDGELWITSGNIGENINIDNFDGTIFIDGEPLPIELLSFSAQKAARGIDINWTTASEVNNMGFEIQRLIPGTDSWESVGFVDGHYNHNGIINYSFTDNFPYEGVNYYQLKQMDYDGAYEIFGPVAENYETEIALSIQVVKSQDGLYVVLPGSDAGQLEMYDMQGRLLLSQFANGKVDLPLSKGTYIVRFHNGLETATAKITM